VGFAFPHRDGVAGVMKMRERSKNQSNCRNGTTGL